MGLFDFFKKKDKQQVVVKENKDGSKDHIAFVSKDSSKGISIEEAKKLQQDIMSKINASDSFSQKVNYAAQFFMKRAYQEAAIAYEKIAQDHPEERGLCEGQIGAAKFFLSDYIGAVDHYKKALELGDTDMQEDNIFEAAEENFKENKDKSLLEEYLKIFPEGQYAKKAHKLL